MMKRLIVLFILGLTFSKVRCRPSDTKQTDLEIGVESSGQLDAVTSEPSSYDRVLQKFYGPYLENGVQVTEPTKESDRTFNKRSDDAPNVRKPLIFKRQTVRKPLILLTRNPERVKVVPGVVEKKVINDPDNGRGIAFSDDGEDIAIDDKTQEYLLGRDRARKPLII